MNYHELITENMGAFGRAVDALRDRNEAVPGLGLVHSPAGRGKTKAIRWYAGEKDAVGLEARALWTPRWMMRDIAQAYGANGKTTKGTTEDLFRLVRGLMEEARVPLIIDEADYLLRGSLLLAAVRDLHDATTAPVVLVGNEEIARHLLKEPKVWSRISQTVEFVPLSEPEVELALSEWCALTLKREALEMLTRETGGDFRLVVVAAEHLERAALNSKTTEVGPEMVRRVLDESMVKRRLAEAIRRRGGAK